MTRKDCILKALQSGEESASNLARVCECPQASVRRTIQELRRDGFNIAFADVNEQIYRIGV
jgi:biotin operon repressor